MRLHRYQVLTNAAGSATVIVLQEPRDPRDQGRLLCDGVPVVPSTPLPCGQTMPGAADHIAGRHRDRFVDPESGLSVLCISGDRCTLSFAGRPLRPHP